MKNLTIGNIAECCCGAFTGAEGSLDCEITSITTDSRKVSPGCLFAALAGERADGHDYIEAALEGGAACVLCQRIPEGFAGNAIVVETTLSALGKIARFYRDGFDIPFIGITGSVGKTTAKEMIACVLSQRYSVHKTSGNYNNELGVPLTLFDLDDRHTAAVVEMGISGFGEMSRLTAMVRPSHAVMTNIEGAHLEGLGDKMVVLRAKSEILEGLSSGGKLFISGDDELLKTIKTEHEKVTFGLSPDCDVRAVNIYFDSEGKTGCVISCAAGSIPIKIPAYGDHMVYAALAACAVGLELGLDGEAIKKGIASYVGVGGRSRLVKSGSLPIVDDCYNANPASVCSALSSLRRLPGRRVCILGDMLELGEESARLHFETGIAARNIGADKILTCGEMSRHTADGAGDIAEHFEDKEKLIERLGELVLPGDAVLVKASRGCAFESIVGALEKLKI